MSNTTNKAFELLPSPFAWVHIPAGQVTLIENRYDGSYIPKGEPKTFKVSAFDISKYPIPNAQYTKFIEAVGHQPRRWLTETGWRVTDGEWLAPRHTKIDSLMQPDCPVVGVSWFQVLAFCVWLSELSGETIMLPTEQQWQRAAQGDDGRAYSWGNEWDASRCNNSVKPHKSSSTTPVTQYEGKSDSPFGVLDMTGNVVEWCLNDYETNEHEPEKIEAATLRGGSWVDTDPNWLRVDFRGANNPNDWEDDWGFRCVRLLSK